MADTLKPAYKFSRITFFGFSESTEKDPEYQLAYELGKRCAAEGYTVVSGGFGGVMEASVKGAKEAGGKTIGVTFYPAGKVIFSGNHQANHFIDKEIITRSYIERTNQLIEVGDAYFVFNGGTGTLSEFGMVWGLAKIYYYIFKPLIFVGKHWHPIVSAIEKGMRNRPVEREVYAIADTADDAMKQLHAFEEKKAKGAEFIKTHRHDHDTLFHG